MKGLALQFNGLVGWELFPDRIAVGFDATVQCALVGLATSRGENKAVPEFGTDLLRNGLLGLMTDLNTTRHLANFAAAVTKETINEHTTDGSTLQNVFLEPEAFSPPSITFNATLISDNNEQRGVLLTSS